MRKLLFALCALSIGCAHYTSMAASATAGKVYVTRTGMWSPPQVEECDRVGNQFTNCVEITEK